MQYGLLKQCLIFLLPPLPTLTHSYPSPCEQALLPEAEEEDGSIEPSSTSAPTAENLTLFLPFELSEKVLQYLSPWDLCQFSGVCLQYREVANSDRLWYAIILSDETLFFCWCQFSGVCLQYREGANSDCLWHQMITLSQTNFSVISGRRREAGKEVEGEGSCNGYGAVKPLMNPTLCLKYC